MSLQNFENSNLAVQGHPRSLILVSMESPDMTSYQSLIVSSLAVSATVFEILTLKARKSQNFHTPSLFEVP